MTGLTAIIVEGESIVALDLQEQFKRFGFGQVTVYSRIDEAVADAEKICPDVLFLAIKDVDFDVEVAKEIKELGASIIYAGTGFYAKKIQLVDPGSAYLKKPFSEEELIAALKGVTENKHY